MKWMIRPAALVFVFSALWTPAASAQNVQAGVKFGVNFANLSFEENDDTEELETRKGILAGGFVAWPVTPSFAVQTEALYSQKGATMSEQGVTGALELDYLDFPILARFSTSPSPAARVHLYAGPSFNFNLRARTKATFEGETSEQDFSDDIKSFDTALVVGGMVEVNRLMFEGRYSWGLTNIDKEDGSSDPTVKNRTLSFTAGLRF